LLKKHDHKTVLILFIILLFLILGITSLAQQDDIELMLNDVVLPTDISPIVVDGHIYLPARDVIEALNGRTTWFPALKLLNLKLGSKEVSLVIDSIEAEVNGKKLILENAPSIIENRVLIPLEVLHLLTDTETEWDKSSQEITITGHKPQVTYIRSFSHPDKTRIVIDISEKSSYHVLTLRDPERLVVDIDASLNQANKKEEEINVDDLLVKKVRSGQFTPEKVRIVADLKGKYEFEVFDLSSPERIVLDIFVPQSQIGTVPQTEIIQETIVVDTKKNNEYVIVLDPGHGGNQPGAIGTGGLKEKDVVLDIALKARKLLQDNGFTVYLTRDKDVDISLEKRPLFALQKEADVFISIHTNSAIQKGSPTAKGIETYVLNSRYIGASAKDVADRENRASKVNNYEDDILNQIIADLEESASIGFSLDFADIVQKNLIQSTSLTNRGVKQAPFIVLKGVNMAAVLIEVGFISNPNEEKLLKTPEFREKVAQALTRSVKDYVKNIPENI
jgi:N-acetylmuramoyl-L-alanine amidase